MLYLRTFVAVCDCGSFTKAARKVNLTQSAVSLHVKRLEDQVGFRLIVRSTRGIRLTEQGEILLPYARRILALYKEAEQRLGRDSRGLIRIIGAPEYFDFHTLWALLQQFRPLFYSEAAKSSSASVRTSRHCSTRRARTTALKMSNPGDERSSWQSAGNARMSLVCRAS